jgi:predicted Mrr-cat superfamily restriction endonuclease
MQQRDAWIVRVNTGGGDVVENGVRDSRLLLGWSGASDLITTEDYWDFREIVHQAHYADDPDYRRSGRAAGQLWHFLNDVKDGDLVVVPHGPSFYVGEVDGPAYFDEQAGWDNDTAHRRPVRWLNAAQPIPRTHARAALIARLKARGTVTSAGDLVDEILATVRSIEDPIAPNLLASLREQLISTTKHELSTGHLDERRFETLVADLLLALGAVEARVVARQHDIGADIEAEFSVGYLASIPARVQVKFWSGVADSSPVDQLLNAMDDVHLGIVVTTASFSDEARGYAAAQSEARGKELVLIDGDELAGLIVEHGLSGLLASRSI